MAGKGTWTSSSWDTYSDKKVAGKTASAIYTRTRATGADEKFLPINIKVRESCDSGTYPASTPVAIGLDVTGSMEDILEVTAKKLGVLCEETFKRRPVTDPQIMFAAIGDSAPGGDSNFPLQVTEFEVDIKIAEQLTELYFEGGGGGNHFESYPLLWYFLANKTSIDSFSKRGQKGFCITMGDDGYPEVLTRSEIKEVFGDTVEADINVKDLLTQVGRKWEVFHLMLMQGGSAGRINPPAWKELMGERAITVKDINAIPEIIVSLLETVGGGKSKDEVVASWDGSTSLAVATALNGLTDYSGTNSVVNFS